MRSCFLFLLLIVLDLSFVVAQETLVVKKFNGRRRYEYSEGEKLKLKLKDSGEVLRGSWEYVGKNVIWIELQEVELDNIEWIDVSNQETGIYLLRKGQDLLILAGLGYFAITQLNSLTQAGEFTSDKGVLKVSGTLIAGGLICAVLDRILLRRKLPVGNERYNVSIIEYL